MDDVDAVQAAISRNMLDSGDWVTAHLDGVRYLEKSPLKYWLIAIGFKLFGVHDYVARLPIALAAVALCWLVTRIGTWAFNARAGLFAGLCLSTCIGLFLFTRILIPDVILTLTITLAMWAFLRALEEEEPRPKLWALVCAASIGTGLLLKGLIAAVFPMAAGFLYLLFTKQLLLKRTWQRLKPFIGLAIILVIAAPWHILAAIRNPPVWYFSFYSGPGQYHGFLWFYFMNEHVLRFLNTRYPRDYNTVPRLAFWLFHLLWLFPWTVYLPTIFKLGFRPVDRAGKMRLLAICWTGFLLIFFTFSSTQEYYSMPCYPALALLLGSAMASPDTNFANWRRRGEIVLASIAILAAMAIAFILARTWNLPTPGDIANALTTQDSNAYTLSLGHMGDLTLASFAYLRLPLIVAGIAFLAGAIGLFLLKGDRRYFAPALMMVLFLHAARLALVTFDPYLSSRPLANALIQAPPGTLIADNQYYTFSSVFFYAHRTAFLLNGRVTNLEYGSNAPDAPKVFITDADLAEKWKQPQRYYLLVERPAVPRVRGVVGVENLFLVRESGGKFLFSNRPVQFVAGSRSR